MCSAIPGRLTQVTHDVGGVRMGKADIGGILERVCLEYTPEASVGDYVLVHVGFALNTVDEAEAERTYGLLRELGQLEELSSSPADLSLDDLSLDDLSLDDKDEPQEPAS